MSFPFADVDLASMGKTLILQLLRSLRKQTKTILVMEAIICYIWKLFILFAGRIVNLKKTQTTKKPSVFELTCECLNL